VADNIQLNTGSGGDVCAADDVGAAKYQRVKIVPGGENVASNIGCTNYSYLSSAAANQDSAVVKASVGVLYGMTVTNSNTVVRYIKLYDLASGATSASTVYRRYMIPAGGGIRENFPYGLAFASGISHRLTTGAANTNAGAVAADEIMVNMEYV